VREDGSGRIRDRPEGCRTGMATLFNRRRTRLTSYQIYRRVVKERKANSHPNVLPIIQVSEAQFPFCIMSPWMPDGNITQYTQMNPGANRLMLVCVHWPGDWWG